MIPTNIAPIAISHSHLLALTWPFLCLLVFLSLSLFRGNLGYSFVLKQHQFPQKKPKIKDTLVISFISERKSDFFHGAEFIHERENKQKNKEGDKYMLWNNDKRKEMEKKKSKVNVYKIEQWKKKKDCSWKETVDPFN